MRGTVVLIEDHDYVRELYASALERAGFRVVQRPGTLDLVELVVREAPDVVILDVVLPWESGVRACARLKADPRVQHTRVLLMTAHDSPETRAAAERVGAERLLPKPLPPVELVAAIDRPRLVSFSPGRA